MDALIDDHEYTNAEKVAMDLGVAVLPNFLKDNTDRNRTSPFAFTGNKFEFRMPGSGVNLSDCNMILNTAMAKSLKDFADAMEGKAGEEFEAAAIDYIRDVLTAHQRIIFNGNGYSEEWTREAERRGLANHPTTADALPCFVEPKSIALFEEFGVLTETEVRSRYEVKLEKYNKLLNIEARTMKRMVRRAYLPAINSYAAEVAGHINAIRRLAPVPTPTSRKSCCAVLLLGIKGDRHAAARPGQAAPRDAGDRERAGEGEHLRARGHPRHGQAARRRRRARSPRRSRPLARSHVQRHPVLRVSETLPAAPAMPGPLACSPFLPAMSNIALAK